MASQSVIAPQKRQANLEKASLIAYNGEAPDIKLMFNPKEISFYRTVNWKENEGNRGTTLLPKINFSGVEPYKFILKSLQFDTYETKKSVMEYIDIIKKGVETITGSMDGRPPVYIFTWKDKYFYCVMTKLTYNLTMFLSDGTPVRATVDISLQEVDKNNLPGGKESASQGQARQPDSRLDNNNNNNNNNNNIQAPAQGQNTQSNARNNNNSQRTRQQSSSRTRR